MDSENFPKKLSRSARRRASRRKAKLPQTTAEGLARPAGEIAAAADVVHVLHQAPFPDHARSIYDQERKRPAVDEKTE